jgi:GTP cyclohydrolase FolE2
MKSRIVVSKLINNPDASKHKKPFRELRAILSLDEFRQFIEKAAPVSGVRGLMDYRCRVVAQLTDRFRLRLGATVPVATVCPCSKEMVEAGAHNQRAEIRVAVEFRGFLWLEDLILHGIT